MMDRVVATAAAAAAAVLIVFACGFAVYALLEPTIGPAGAAGSVAMVAGLGLIIFALVLQHRARKREAEAALARAQAAEAAQFGLGDIARDRPLVTLAVTAVSSLIAARNPSLVRELVGMIARFRR
jgi:hypothetical protein